MELRVLGALEVTHAGERWDVPGVRTRVVLAVLAARNGRVVSVDELIEAVWDGPPPPPTARSQIQICISQVRRTLRAAGRDDALSTRFAGYQLQLSPEELDAGRFDRLTAEARRLAGAGQVPMAVERLRAAEALCLGTPLAGLPGDRVAAWRRELVERHNATVEERIRLELTLGRHDELIGELESLVRAHPLRERTRAYLMLALYRADRQSDALSAYREARAVFVEELGMEPGAELSRLERLILSRDPALDSPTPSAAWLPVVPASRDAAAVPRQLPADIADFTGRASEIAEIRQLLSGTGIRIDPHTAPLVVLSGQGGSGKTCLAVHAAHTLLDQFPDGQLYVNLDDACATPDRVGDVLNRLLQATGVAGTAVPDSVTERAALFRSRLAERRMLLLLDNATDEAQVLPLWPNTGGCGVIVTARTRMTALPGAHLVDLTTLSLEDSLALLHQIVGPRVLAQPAEAGELARLCGNLPLALRIAGARLASRPHWQVSRLVARLRDETLLLDELVHRDMCVRSTLTFSYDGLPAAARRLLRRLAVLRCDDFPGWIAGALVDEAPAAVDELVEQLVDARLVEAASEPVDGSTRYRLHDIVRAFARERLTVEEPAGAGTELIRRAVSCWLTVAAEAHRREYGGDYTIVHGRAPRRPLRPELFDELLGRPIEWLEAERYNLIAAVRLAAEHDLDELCWDLAFTLVTLFEARGCYDDWEDTAAAALTAARRAGNRLGEAVTLHSLGTLYMFQRHPARARQMFRDALPIQRATGNAHLGALIQRNLAYLEQLGGDDAAAISRYRRALGPLRAAGDHVGEAHVMVNLARVLSRQGQAGEAGRLLDQALRICHRVGIKRVEAQARHQLGELHLRTGDLGGATEAFQQTLHLVRDGNDRIGEAYAAHGLGVVHSRAGDQGRAHSWLTEALRLAEQSDERLIEGQSLYELAGLPRTEPAEAGRMLRRAIQIFEQLQARIWVARAHDALATL
ncbi:AfsR/SARP family transcriptional regulator [Catenuloplanes indicus]|uniref:DNA-binding SARP family transcriptional activator/Tfp pilus assembly protein PilF n=1 Tax=Catenuloplanes indicus TaxID=137267 RepID=A0AAE3VUJ5_9ACTN|nr:AfsR/SARP family transcriptional regulator [Catenuloplanes indicus]MDQ0363924.1 DNA-binding SARP family transcriptional activator/Tfp pilus assembly protein PilF [Catenuloplanes indicus]